MTALADLESAYPGNVLAWLELPRPVLLGMWKQIPRVQAVGSLLRAQQIALGMGQLSESDAAALERHWSDLAEFPRVRRSVAERRAAAAAMGITVVPPSDPVE